MEKLSQTLVSKITMLQRRFESFLDNDFESKVEETDRKQAPFEASRDLALVRGLSHGLPEDHIDRAIVVFSRLALLFDAGILLENNDGQWRAQASFYKGASQLLKNNAKMIVKVPEMTMMSILRTDSQAMLEKLHLQHLDPENKTTCLLMKASPDFAFLLFSEMADLWLKEHIENVRRALINGFAD
ncbi:GTP cyclohydrolase [Bdellovibrio sp. 22V]|uniref:GTP cyclohydrolase n=1 Tax=Bdellovibrio TaxID=958 RepID=UPI002543F294|nr:GTP cyclohydrolase [Bdellovibrio sp. 22V]WII71216.1 GTP cyclohydrolase [Bdellovibrio sp. 22V]